MLTSLSALPFSKRDRPSQPSGNRASIPEAAKEKCGGGEENIIRGSMSEGGGKNGWAAMHKQKKGNQISTEMMRVPLPHVIAVAYQRRDECSARLDAGLLLLLLA